MNIYFTDSRSFLDARFARLAKSTSAKPRRLVIFHGADEGMPYEALPVLLEAGRHFAVETAAVKKVEEIFLNVGIAFGRKKPADQYSCLFSDAELEESLAGYGIKAYSPSPAPKAEASGKARSRKAEPVTEEKHSEGLAEEPVFSEMPAPTEDAPENPQEEGTKPCGYREIFVDFTAPGGLFAPVMQESAGLQEEEPREEEDAKPATPDLVTDFRQFKAMLGIRAHQMKSYRGNDDELASDVIGILWDMKKAGKEIADAKPAFLERFGEDGETVFLNVSKNYSLFLKPMLLT